MKTLSVPLSRLTLSFLLPFWLGCATVDVSIKQDFDFKKINRIGVLGFNVPDSNQHKMYGQLASDTFTIRGIEAGLTVVERNEIEKIMKELNLGQSGAIDVSTAKQVGRVAGVDAMIMGSIIPSVAYQGTTGPPQLSINLTAKMVYVETGEIVFAGTAEVEDYDPKKAIRNCVNKIVKALQKERQKG